MGGKTGDFYRIEGIMKKEQYHSILSQHAVPFGLCLGGNNVIFQEDNDPKHSSKFCQIRLLRILIHII